MYIPKSQIAQVISGRDLIYKSSNEDYSLDEAFVLRNNKIYGTDGKELLYKANDKDSDRKLLIDNKITRSLISLKSLPSDHYQSEGIMHYFAYNDTQFKEISLSQYREMDSKEKGSIDYYMYKNLSISLENINTIYYTNYNIYTYLHNTYLSL